jgi:tetratricopeptide (TPR) repeat protein
MAFAQLAEECRRGGDNEEAVSICRRGLAYHHDYLSARVTLGRALTELGRLDEAETELTIVLNTAPDNLAANRAMAEICQQRGKLEEALTYYKTALLLAQHDPDLELAVERIEHAVSPPPPPKTDEAVPTSIEDLFDFDTLLAQLGGGTPPQSETAAPLIPLTPLARPLAEVELPADEADPFALLEKHLRESDEHRPYEDPEVLAQQQHEQRAIAELEVWLAAIVSDRDHQASA